MKILVTGAKGMLGQDLCPILEDEGFEVIETDIDTLDITDLAKVKTVINENKPDYVIHCAAYTNVDKAEEDKENAFKINAEGTGNLAQTCKKADIPIIYISTDYVFDGKKEGKYLVNDKPNPINVYGASKLGGEKEILQCEKYYIARTSWLYGHHGKNFVETMIELKDKEAIKVVDDQTGCPTWTVALAEGILKLIKGDAPYGIYHICGRGYTSRFGFAKKIFELCDADVKVIPCSSAEFPRAAARPKNSAMDNNNICDKWEISLKEYINLRCE